MVEGIDERLHEFLSCDRHIGEVVTHHRAGRLARPQNSGGWNAGNDDRKEQSDG